MRWLKRLIAPGLGMFLLWLLSFGGLHDIVANESMDLLFRLRGPVKPDQRIVIVGVDEPSLSALGRWPFPRRFHGELLSHLHGARAISFDFFFPEASADDRSLSVAMQAAPPVLLPVAFVDNDEALLPTPSLSGYAGLGHIETLLSGDGIVRRVSLAPKKGIPAFSVGTLNISGLSMPSDVGLQEHIINFYGSEDTFLTLSYKDVLAGRYSPDFFRDRFVLIGAKALGLGDSHVTAFTRITPTPGIEIQATILANILNQSFISTRPQLTFVLIGIIWLLAVFVWPEAGERRNLIWNGFFSGFIVLLALVLFYQHLFFNYAAPLLFLVITYLLHLFQAVVDATRHILQQAYELDQQLDERLQQTYAQGGVALVQMPGKVATLLSPGGIQEHLQRLKNAARALSFQHHFLENLLGKELPPIILWNGRNGKMVFANTAFNMFWRAFSPEQAASSPSYDTFTESVSALRHEETQNVDLADPSEVNIFDIQVHMPQGRRFLQGNLHHLSVPGTDFDGILVVLQDITDIKELERVKDEVVSIVSHELKQPLTVILGYGQMLTEGLGGAERMYAEKICGQAERLNRMIRDFLDIARLESGRQQVKRFPFPLERVVDEALDTIKTSAAKKSIRLTENTPTKTTPYLGDEALLIHAVLNLLDNAVKFSPAETIVEVSLQEEADQFVLKIADQGPGIPKEELESVFNKFQRGSRTEKDDGFGLGLHLVHQIIEGHRGTIAALDVPLGATFEIRLPKENP